MYLNGGEGTTATEPAPAPTPCCNGSQAPLQCFSSVANGIDSTQASTQATMDEKGPKLYHGEILDFVSGHPCMYKFIPPRLDTTSPFESQPATDLLPLIVLIPGGAHNARIFYGGHKGHNPADYLSFWLTKLGFPVLAISYPLESKPTLMPAVSPGFRISTWGRQAASITHKVIESSASLSGRDVLLIGWSMGGRLLAPFSEAMANIYGHHVGLFVSLAATPGVAGLRPPPPGITQTARGYATCDGLLETFVRQIAGVIPKQLYETEYYGHTPASLHGWRRSYAPSTGSLVPNHWGSEEDASPTGDDFSILPWTATIVGTESQDARHVLTDRAAWENMSGQRLTSIWEHRDRFRLKSRIMKRPQGFSFGTKDDDKISRSNDARCSPDSDSADHVLRNGVGHSGQKRTGPGSTATQSQWDEYSSFVLETMPGALSCRVPGNHFFFLGAEGAQKTAESIAKLWWKRCGLDQALWSILAGKKDLR